MDDESCVLRLADNGHSPEVLGAILRDAREVLRALVGLGPRVTPPTGHDSLIEGWKHMSARLGATLCVGALRLHAQQGNVAVEVKTLFDKHGKPEATQLRVAPDAPLDVSPFELSADSAEDAIQSAHKGEVAQRLIAAVSGGTYFRLDADEFLLEFGAPLGLPADVEPGLLGDAKPLDAASALLRVGHLVRVVGLLAGETGPYR